MVALVFDGVSVYDRKLLQVCASNLHLHKHETCRAPLSIDVDDECGVEEKRS